jgi:hypothetical protein
MSLEDSGKCGKDMCPEQNVSEVPSLTKQLPGSGGIFPNISLNTNLAPAKKKQDYPFNVWLQTCPPDSPRQNPAAFPYL